MNKKSVHTGKPRKLWQFPWSFREGFLLAGFLILTGFLIQLLTGSEVHMPAWPVNIAIVLIFIIYFILVHHLIKHPLVRWLSSNSAAITSMSGFTLMVLVLGFVSQTPETVNPRLIDQLGFTNVTSSWAYTLSAVYLLVVLGFTIVRRFNSYKLKNIAFLLYHAGLWIVIVSASVGSADMWRLHMQLQKNHPVLTAYDAQRQVYNMGFGMMLLDFSIEEYPAEVGLMRNEDYSLHMQKGGKLATIEEGTSARLENFTIDFVRYISNARLYDHGYDTSSAEGGAHAVYVEVKNNAGTLLSEGWVSNGSYSVPPAHLVINEELSVAMLESRPKKYSSEVRVYRSMDDYEDIRIEVNKPVKIDGWKIYQTGYDERMGRWSEKSVIELVRDPWLPVVYTGIFMILVGVLYLLWMGKGRIRKEAS